MTMITAAPEMTDLSSLDVPSYFPVRSSSSNYLNHCVEELRPENAPSNSKAWLWTIASIATIAAFGALVGVAMVAAAALAGTGVSLVASTVLFLGGTYFAASLAVKYGSKFIFNAQQALGEANSLKEISQRVNSLPTEGNFIVGKLVTMSILWSSIRGMQQPENLSALNPLIARYDYWVNQKELWEQKVKRKLALAAEVAIRAPNGETELHRFQNPIKTHLQKAFKNQQEALICKVYAAFTHAVIQRPDFVGDFGNLASFVQVSLQDRTLAEQLGARPLANELVLFPHANVRALTLDEIKGLPINLIAQRFIQAMPPAPAAA